MRRNSPPVADVWFSRGDTSGGVTMLTEPHVHPLLRCNIWHVAGRIRHMLVDTGVGVARLREAARDLFDHPVVAVATHYHMDHIGGFAEFTDRVIHSAEADLAAIGAGVFPLLPSGYDAATRDGLAAVGLDVSDGLFTAYPDDAFDPAEHRLVAAAATRVVDDGDVVDLGDRAFEVLHVPGHSPGSIALWESSTGTLFSGDAVYDGTLLDDLPDSDREAYAATMHRLRILPVDCVHGGHGPSMDRRRFREVIDAYLDSRG